MAAYRSIPFLRFALAAVVVSIPAILLEQTGKEKEAWTYVALVLLMLLVFYSNPLSRAASFTSSIFRKG